MTRIRSGAVVTGLVAAALAVVGVLAAQAPGIPAPPVAAAARPAGDRQGLPADSGTGSRVVYSVGQARVWLVGDHDAVLRTYRVTAGGLAPSPGSHTVFARGAQGRGGDGEPVEHVVLFAATDGTNVGFSAALNGSLGPHVPDRRSGAIRQTRADGAALWQRAAIGSDIEVVP
ncbi:MULTISPECIES: hypothetical protein [unclassified Streptomyces]|uniref:hypothetical protein n=1 Tax=unclassified Streptomyces TaxID=2593676 RepID=UPI002E298AB5|nr:hypothetical protein [Streptomyces sp. NBC_00223]